MEGSTCSPSTSTWGIWRPHSSSKSWHPSKSSAAWRSPTSSVGSTLFGFSSPASSSPRSSPPGRSRSGPSERSKNSIRSESSRRASNSSRCGYSSLSSEPEAQRSRSGCPSRRPRTCDRSNFTYIRGGAGLHDTGADHALRSVSGHGTDVIVVPRIDLDCEMPGFAGTQAVRRVQTADSDPCVGTNNLEPVEIPAVVPERDVHRVPGDGADLRASLRELVEPPFVLPARDLVSGEDGSGRKLDRRRKDQTRPNCTKPEQSKDAGDDPCGDIRANGLLCHVHIS